MPTYKIEVDDERDPILRDVARVHHRPVLWQAEKLLADAIDQAGADLPTGPAIDERPSAPAGTAR